MIPSSLGLAYAALGRRDDAVRAGGRAIDRFTTLLAPPTYLRVAFLRIDPTLEALRANPRFRGRLDRN